MSESTDIEENVNTETEPLIPIRNIEAQEKVLARRKRHQGFSIFFLSFFAAWFLGTKTYILMFLWSCTCMEIVFCSNRKLR